MALPTASDNLFPKVNLDMQTSAPSAPSGEDWKMYAKADGIYARSSNAEVGPFGAAGAALSFGSNAMAVGATNQAGTAGGYVGIDHRHQGLHSITSSSSNTLGRPVVNFRAGANIGLAASDTDGDGEFDTVTIVATAGGGGGTTFTGQPVAVSAPPVYGAITAGTNNTAQVAWAFPMVVTGTMKVRGIQVDITSSNTGQIQWGLFSYANSASSATKLVGGSAAPGGTGWRAIAATGAPVTVSPGNYMFVMMQPAANVPTIRCGLQPSSTPWNQVFTTYTWTDTPDFTSASWAANTTHPLVYMEGDLLGSGTSWT